MNSEVAAAWFGTVEAPKRHLVWFEHSAHMPMTEEPGKFLFSLLRFAGPLAEKAGEALRDPQRLPKTERDATAVVGLSELWRFRIPVVDFRLPHSYML